MSRHENQNKNCEKSHYVYSKIGITQIFDIEETKQRGQIRVVKVKKKYIWKRIMKVVTSYFWNLEPTPRLYRLYCLFYHLWWI